MICSHPICIIWPFREQHWTKLSISCTFLSSPHLTCGQRKHTKLFQHENYSMEAWEAFVEKKTTKGFIFKPLPKVFKLRILSGCWGLVLKVFSILQSLKVCHCFSQVSVWAPLGQTRKLSISTYFHFQTIFNNFPTIILKILKNTVTISRYIVFLEHIKSHFLGWSVPRCHFYRPWNVSFKKERNFYLTFSFTKKM